MDQTTKYRSPRQRKDEEGWLSKIWVAILVIGIVGLAMLGVILGLSAATVAKWRSYVYTCPLDGCPGICEIADDCPVLTWNESRLYSQNATADVGTQCVANACVYIAYPNETLAEVAYIADFFNNDNEEAKRIYLSLFEDDEFNSCLHYNNFYDAFIYFFDCAKPDWMEFVPPASP